MSFFDKFFINRNRNNNNETSFKTEIENLRECDKRGRKLLFDSSSVEKVPLPVRETMCNSKCQNQSEKADFIEVSCTHGYKYKKPPSDVSSLGEMVFGSVAVVYKAKNSCKIHSIPSPKRLMFTTIIHAPFHRSPGSTISELSLDHSSESSVASLSNILNEQLTTSSDSKLYKHERIAQKYSSTYPWIKHSFPVNKVEQCCEINDTNCKLNTKSYFGNNSELKCSESLHEGKKFNGSQTFCGEESFSTSKNNNLCLGQKNSECERNSLSNCGSSGNTSDKSGEISSFSGSLSSLRRRWAHSHSTSLDSTAFEDTSNSLSKKRTKLGMALILDLSKTLENEIEKFLFNHTILIDSIMSKLQDSVELAYIKNDSFVDLIYSAFLECQESIYELITSGKYDIPLWCTLLGETDDALETHLGQMNCCKKNVRIYNEWNVVNNMQQLQQIKFLNDFSEILIKFDTKDTNFFISTLLTAVLTHHLSWVTLLADVDLKSLNEKLPATNSIRPYNPIWAQMNDLCGLLGSPLKSAKTVVTGPESKKNQLTTIIEVLTYFIRCNNVVENIYEVDVEDIIRNADLESDLHSVIKPDVCSTYEVPEFEKQCFNTTMYKSETGKSTDERQEFRENFKKEILLLQQSDFKKSDSQTGLKRSKSYLSHVKLKDSVSTNELYPDIKELVKNENINITDLNYEESEPTIFVENFLSNEKLKEKIQKLIRVPNISVERHMEGHLSPDEGYDTIDSTKTDNFKVNKAQMERQCSATERKKENIIFLLGENEELVNLQKKVVVRKSSFVDMEKEGTNELSSTEYTCVNTDHNETKNERNCWVSENSCDSVDRTFWMNHTGENFLEHSNKDSFHHVSITKPWIVREIKMPRVIKPCRTRKLEVSSVFGGVNQYYNSEQVIQGVLEPKETLERALQKDLFLCSHNPILEKNVAEALCIVGDMNTWEVTVFSSNKSVLDFKKQSSVRVGMSQLVADMLESFLYLHTSNLSPSFCLLHIEKKLHEIYLKSKTVAELLNSTELCSMDYLTTSLDIGINDVPLLLSVATTHSPHIAEKYVLSYS